MLKQKFWTGKYDKDNSEKEQCEQWQFWNGHLKNDKSGTGQFSEHEKYYKGQFWIGKV